jgi:hypothetical protein
MATKHLHCRPVQQGMAINQVVHRIAIAAADDAGYGIASGHAGL